VRRALHILRFSHFVISSGSEKSLLVNFLFSGLRKDQEGFLSPVEMTEFDAGR
jgi:hypothetical protein